MSKYAHLKQDCDHEIVLLKNCDNTSIEDRNVLLLSMYTFLNFPPPPKRGKEYSTTYCNVYGSVRWCCCRLFLLSTKREHGSPARALVNR